MAALHDDLWHMVGSHLSPRDLLSLSGTCRSARRSCAALVVAVTVVCTDGAEVRVFLNSPADGRAGAGGGSLPVEAQIFPADPGHLVTAGPLGAAHARSLLSFLLATRPRRLGIQRQAPGAPRPQYLGPSTPFFHALFGGLRYLPLQELALDDAAVAALAPAHRLPPHLSALSLTSLCPTGRSATIQASPAIAAALAASTLHTLRLFPRPQFASLPSAAATCSSFLGLPQPALKHLSVGCCLEVETLAAIARLDALLTLRLSSRVVDGGLATLALPALPMLQNLYLGACPRSRQQCVRTVLRGRSLRFLSLGVPPYAEADGVVQTLACTRELPAMVDLRSGAVHTDVRPLTNHFGRGTLRSLAFTLGGDADNILTAIAASLPALQDLSLHLIGGAREILSWPPSFRLERLSLYCGTQGRRGVDANRVLTALGGSASMCQHLRFLILDADLSTMPSDSTIHSLGKLHRLTSSRWIIRCGSDWQYSEALLRATVCGKIHTQWVTKALPAQKSGGPGRQGQTSWRNRPCQRGEASVDF